MSEPPFLAGFWTDRTVQVPPSSIIIQAKCGKKKSDRQRRLLAYHYGLGTLQCNSISETAAYFHLTEKYLKVIEAKALATLRDGMNDGKIL